MKKLLIVIGILILGQIPVWCYNENPFQPPKPSELIFSDLATLTHDKSPSIRELQLAESLIVEEEENLQQEQSTINGYITTIFILVALTLSCLLIWILRGAH